MVTGLVFLCDRNHSLCWLYSCHLALSVAPLVTRKHSELCQRAIVLISVSTSDMSVYVGFHWEARIPLGQDSSMFILVCTYQGAWVTLLPSPPLSHFCPVGGDNVTDGFFLLIVHLSLQFGLSLPKFYWDLWSFQSFQLPCKHHLQTPRPSSHFTPVPFLVPSWTHVVSSK